MKVTKVYKKGINDINEDAYTINDAAKLYAVMDGATGLDGVPGHLASQIVQAEMDVPDAAYPLQERITVANQYLKERIITYYAEHIAKGDHAQVAYTDIKKIQRSTTGIAAIQMNEEQTFFKFAHAGDCMIYLQYENGDIRALTYDLVQYFDQMALHEMARLNKELQEDNPSFDMLKEKVTPILIENRGKLNTREGYSIIDGSPEAIAHMEYGKISLKRVAKILLLSDGLQMPIQEEETGAWEKAVQIAFDKGLDCLLEMVDEKECADNDCSLYPRMKFQDDKTGILIEL